MVRNRERRKQRPPEDLLERTRAAVALCNVKGCDDEDFRLEAFMGLFHPELQGDRDYMRELRAAARE